MASIPKPPLRGKRSQSQASGGEIPSPSLAASRVISTRSRATASREFPLGCRRPHASTSGRARCYFGSNDYAFDAWGYSTDLDLAYQSTMTELARFLDHVPCFEGMRQCAPLFGALPPALGALTFADRYAWRERWRDEAIALQSKIIAALIAAGIPRPSTEDLEPTVPMVALDSEDEPETPLALAVHSGYSVRMEKPATSRGGKVTKASRRKESGQREARKFRDEGLTRKEIATHLNCSLRTVDNYLADSQTDDY